MPSRKASYDWSGSRSTTIFGRETTVWKSFQWLALPLPSFSRLVGWWCGYPCRHLWLCGMKLVQEGMSEMLKFYDTSRSKVSNLRFGTIFSNFQFLPVNTNSLVCCQTPQLKPRDLAKPQDLTLKSRVCPAPEQALERSGIMCYGSQALKPSKNAAFNSFYIGLLMFSPVSSKV